MRTITTMGDGQTNCSKRESTHSAGQVRTSRRDLLAASTGRKGYYIRTYN